MFHKSFVLGLCISASLFASDGASILNARLDQVQVGVHGGPSFKDFNTRSSTGIDENNGYAIGLHAESSGKFFALRPEINYVVRGFNVANTADVEHRYIEVPILARVKFSPWRVQPILEAGPNFSARVDSEIQSTPGASFINTAKRYDLSVIGSAGFAINLAENISLDLIGRYIHGFRDLDSSALEVKTRSVQFIASATASF